MPELELSIMERGNDPVADLGAVLAPFEAQHKVTVKLTILKWDSAWEALVKYSLYKHGPDVSELGTTWVSGLKEMDALRPFAPSEVAALGGQGAFAPATWQSATVGNTPEVWTIPWLADVRALFYRRHVLEQVGLDERLAFTNARDLTRTLAQLQAKGIAIPWTAPTLQTLNTLHAVASWVWGAGGEFVSADGRQILFNRPEALAAITEYFDLRRFLVPEAQGLDSIQSDGLFIQGSAAVTVTGSWLASPRFVDAAIMADLGVAPMPGVSFVGGSNLAVWRHVSSQHERLALELVRYLVGYQAQNDYHRKVGMLPVRLDLLGESSGPDRLISQTLNTALRTGRSFPSLFVWGLVEDRLTVTLAAIWAELLKNPSASTATVVADHINGLAHRLNLTLGR
jgi:multiple sugar transport system substrate-binding protein